VLPFCTLRSPDNSKNVMFPRIHLTWIRAARPRAAADPGWVRRGNAAAGVGQLAREAERADRGLSVDHILPVREAGLVVRSRRADHRHLESRGARDRDRRGIDPPCPAPVARDDGAAVAVRTHSHPERRRH
jgi:hypothetical protein